MIERMHGRGFRHHRAGSLLAAMVVAAVALGGCRAAGDPDPTGAGDDPGPVHVHGLGVNPADDLVYVATHTGLWRLDAEGRPERVGEALSDFMGFSVVGPDHFYASGHPDLRTDQPPLLGLIESRDGGVTWDAVALSGAADFHALRALHERIYGWSSTDGMLMVSRNGGHWDRRGELPLLDFAVHPDEPDTVLATTAAALDDSALTLSRDGGMGWRSLDAPALDRLSWQAADRLFAVGLDGRVWRSSDEAASWQEVGALPGRAGALLDTGEVLYAAAGDAILRSADDGQTWEPLYEAAP